MKNINELHFEPSVRYSVEHTWAKAEGEIVISGISDYAQDQLGEIIFVELPNPGDRFARDEQFGVVESAKSVSELYMPVSGEIVEVNTELETAPEIVNDDPFGAGWMIKLRPDDSSELESLLNDQDYKNSIKD